MTRPLPVPPRQPEDEPFWAAAAEGRLLVRRCDACGRTHWYPRPVCPFCQGDTQWEEQARAATIYSFTVVPKSPRGPFALGYVELAEGLRIYGGFAPDALDRLAIGARVTIGFTAAEDGTHLPIFIPDQPTGDAHET